MDDTRRFLRYITPGLLFGFELPLFLGVLFPRWTRDQLASLTDEAGLGLVLTALLATGGLGFLFSVLHHAWHWRGDGVVNHRTLVVRLVANNVIQIHDPRHHERTFKEEEVRRDLDRQTAWIIVSSLWFPRLGSDKLISGAEAKTSALTDLMHALGTARVATIAAILAAMVIAALGGTPDLEAGIPMALMLTIAVLLLAVQWASYRRLGVFAQRVIDEILTDALTNEVERERRAIKTFSLLDYATWKASRRPVQPT